MPYVGTQPRPPAPSLQVTLWHLRLENQDIAAKADIVINQLIKHRPTGAPKVILKLQPNKYLTLSNTLIVSS